MNTKCSLGNWFWCISDMLRMFLLNEALLGQNLPVQAYTVDQIPSLPTSLPSNLSSFFPTLTAYAGMHRK